MKRKLFLQQSLLAVPAILFNNKSQCQQAILGKEPFVVGAGKSRFGNSSKFMGLHPNDLKISAKDTAGALSVFEYTGLAKIGPALHVHFEQDEIFMVTEGSYRFVVGEQTLQLNAGETIFLPRTIPHTWIQLTDKGKLIYFLQPAGKMEDFFACLDNLKEMPDAQAFDRIHAQHGMKVVGPPLTL
ncbi:MAG: hypothetical protein RL172_1883 [Bacteroidota bacterium]|jgi:quercetin dioxygenase-like cupin family protein